MAMGTVLRNAVTAGVKVERSAGAQRLLSHFRPRLGQRLNGRELCAETVVALALVAAAALLALLAPAPARPPAGVVGLFVALYAVMSWIQFEVAAGYGTPTSLLLIPMLYALPPGWVPLVAAGALVLSKLPSIAAGTRHPNRALASIADAWHAFGPAVVFAVARLTTPKWSDWPILLAVLGAQLLCDIAASAAREWIRLGELPKLPLRLMGSVYLTDVCLTPIGVGIAFASAGHAAGALLSLPLGGLLLFFARDRRARIETTVELSRAYRGTALLLGDVVEADDAYTGSHSRDVVELSMSVGPMLGLDEDALRRLEFAALLHDVGKIAIPNEIINKPGKLTPEERAIIETHTVEGEKMLENVGGLLGEVGRIVRSCHERHDGGGYPDGLAGDAIPVEARIVACCDAFNAMTTTRSYRKALPLEVALEELRRNRGTQFAPDVVDALLVLHERELAAAGDAAAPAPESPPAPAITPAAA